MILFRNGNEKDETVTGGARSEESNEINKTGTKSTWKNIFPGRPEANTGRCSVRDDLRILLAGVRIEKKSDRLMDTFYFSLRLTPRDAKHCLCTRKSCVQTMFKRVLFGELGAKCTTRVFIVYRPEVISQNALATNY